MMMYYKKNYLLKQNKLNQSEIFLFILIIILFNNFFVFLISYFGLYILKEDFRKLFNNAVKISQIMANIGIAPNIIHINTKNMKIIFQYIQHVKTNHTKFVEDVIKSIDKMHLLGYGHGDLHLGNIINGADKVYLIDFDHSYNIIDGKNDPCVLDWMNNNCGIDNYDDFVKWDYHNFIDEIDGMDADEYDNFFL